MAKSYSDLLNENARENEKRFDGVASEWNENVRDAMEAVRKAMGAFATVFAEASEFQTQTASAGRTLDANDPGAYEDLVESLVEADDLRAEMQATLAGSFLGEGVREQNKAHVAAVEALEAADDDETTDAGERDVS